MPRAEPKIPDAWYECARADCPEGCSFAPEDLHLVDGEWLCATCAPKTGRGPTLARWLARHGPLAFCRDALRHVMSKIDRPILIDRELVQEALGDRIVHPVQ